MITPALFGPIDVLAEEVVSGVTIVEFLLLGLVIVNLAVRAIAYRGYVNTATEEGVDAVSRNLALEATNVLLVIGSFYYITVQLHGGIIFATLVLGLVLTDFFEFEARLVEARTEVPFERPKGAIFASMLVFAYIAYQSLFFVVEPLWNSIV